MGRIDDLVRELCPDGVEYRSIGSLIKRKSVKASKYNSDVDVYAVTNKRGFVLSSSLHDFDIFSSDISNYNVVEADDFAYNPSRLNIGSIALFKGKTIGAVSPMYVVFEVDKESVLPEYLMVCFRSHSVTHSIESMKEVGARFRFDFQKWERISIPLPPLSIQQQIVEVLDLFTDLLDNLEKELGLREKQMTYYREKLLSFEEEEVEYTTLGEVLDYEQPSKYLVKSTQYDDSYSTPVLTAGKGFLLGYTNEEDGIYQASKEAPTIIFDDFVTSFHWVDFPHKVKSSAIKFLRPKKSSEVSFRFVYYAMNEIRFVAKEHTRHWISVYSQFQIPLPSLARQQKIVEVLDTFTDLIDNIKQEITLRQKQYEYYRERLLTFKTLKRAS